MSSENIIRALQHIALTIEQATGLEPNSIAGLTGIWGQVSEKPESLDDPAVRDAFVAAVNQALPEFSLSRNLQWQALWRGAAQQTQITARRFAGVDHQALISLRDWLYGELGTQHEIFSSPEWEKLLRLPNKMVGIYALRDQLVTMGGPDVLNWPEIPQTWRIYLQREIEKTNEANLHLLAEAESLRTRPQTALAEYGAAIQKLVELERNLQSDGIASFQKAQIQRAAHDTRKAALSDARKHFSQFPAELLDTLAITAHYLDVLKRGNFSSAAQVLQFFDEQQIRLGTLFLRESDMHFFNYAGHRVLVPFDFSFVGDDGHVEYKQRLRDETETDHAHWIERGMTELEIEAKKAFADLGSMRDRLDAIEWAILNFGDEFPQFLARFLQVHDLGSSFSELEHEVQMAAQERFGADAPHIDWIQVFFFAYHDLALRVGGELADDFVQRSIQLFPERGLLRFTQLDQITQDFLDVVLEGGAWRERFPVSTVMQGPELGARSVLVRLGEVLVNAEMAAAPMNPDFFVRLFTTVRAAPELKDFHEFPAHVFSFLAQGEYYFYLVANEEFERAQAVHQQIGDAVIYLAASLRFQAFPVEVVLEDGSRFLIPQSAEGQQLISFGDSVIEAAENTVPAVPSLLAQIGGFFYDGLLRSAIMGAVVEELLPVVNEPGAQFLRAFASGQIEKFLQESGEVNAALQDFHVDIRKAVEEYLETQPASARAHWERALQHLPENIQKIFQKGAASVTEEVPMEQVGAAPSSVLGSGHIFAPEVDTRMQELIAKLGRGTSSVLPAEDFFPTTVTTSEPIPENLSQLKLPGFTVPEVSVALPPREAIKPEDLPTLTLERSRIISLKVPKMMPEVDGYVFADYPAQPFTAAQLADAMSSQGLSNQPFVLVRLEGQAVQVWDLNQLQEFLTGYEQQKKLSDAGFAEPNMLPPVLFPIGSPAALSVLFADFELAKLPALLPALAH